MLGRIRPVFFQGQADVLQLAGEVEAKSGEHVKPLVDILPYGLELGGGSLRVVIRGERDVRELCGHGILVVG